MTNLDSILKIREITLPTNVQVVKAMVFPRVMWELDYKESWALKNWCFWTVVLVKTRESLGLQGDPTSLSYRNQSWIFIGRTDAEAETPILWQTDVENWLIGKDPDAEKDWRREEKVMTEDEMAGWHRRLYGHEFEQAPGDSEDEGSPGVLQSMGFQKVWHDWAAELNWTDPQGKLFNQSLSYPGLPR